jgi:hypothetical protein
MAVKRSGVNAPPLGVAPDASQISNPRIRLSDWPTSKQTNLSPLHQFCVANVAVGSKTEIEPRNPNFRSSLNSRHSPTRRSRPKSADIAPRLAVFGLLGHVGNQASTRKTLGQKIRLQPCIRHTGRPRTAGARQRTNERRNGDAGRRAVLSCSLRSISPFLFYEYTP